MRKITIIALVVMSSLIGLLAVSVNGAIWSQDNKSNLGSHLFEPKRSLLQVKSHVTDDFNSGSLLEKAQNSDVQAQYELALQYQSGTEVGPDQKKAGYWFLKAAEQGLREAQTRIGVAYLGGIGVFPDWEKGIGWLEKAAIQEDPLAQMTLSAVHLGELKHKWPNSPHDYNKAFYWMQKAAQNRLAPAQHEVSRMYAKGVGIAVDKQKAAYWLKQAANNGWKSSMKALGDAYETGALGLAKDVNKAMEWHKKAESTQ